jgi:tRNA nucleotidyltransferase (CCA-adding enzyme)
MEVLDAPSWRRLIDGTQLAKALDVKPGKWMAAALDVCMAWQFRNPKATDPAEAVQEVEMKAKELGIPLK